MRFRIEGTYTRGSSEGPFTIDAPSAEEARRRAADAGIVVTAVFPSLGAPGERGAATAIGPRPDLASGARTWPQLIMPARWAGAKRALGWGATLLAWVGVVGILGLYSQIRDARMGALWFGLFMGLLSAAAALLLGLFRVGKRLRAAGALTALKHDSRPPVLLLRSFRDDQVAVENRSPREPWWSFGQRKVVTFEEMLYDLFSACGPVIAVGRPGEVLAPLGAARFWVSDARWQQVVGDLLQESQLVVLIMGPTTGDDGLAWEVRRVFEFRQTAKLVLVMPPLEEELARQRWESFRPLCQGRLPPYRGGELAAAFANDGPDSGSRIFRRASTGHRPRDDDYRNALRVIA